MCVSSQLEWLCLWLARDEPVDASSAANPSQESHPQLQTLYHDTTIQPIHLPQAAGKQDTMPIQSTNPITHNLKPLPLTLLNQPPQKPPINTRKTPLNLRNQFIHVNKPLLIHHQTSRIMPQNITNKLADLNPQITLHNETSHANTRKSKSYLASFSLYENSGAND